MKSQIRQMRMRWFHKNVGGTVVVYFKALLSSFLKGLRKTMKTLNHDSRSSGRDSNRTSY